MRFLTNITFLVITLSVNPLFADLDRQVQKDQEEVDNEAVVVYGGKVGKLEAIFHIEWAGKNLDGWYYYPSRGKQKIYTLKGTNPKDGVIILQEYSDKGKLLSNCRLTKTITKGRITWKGKMNNTDGRQLDISFYRKP